MFKPRQGYVDESTVSVGRERCAKRKRLELTVPLVVCSCHDLSNWDLWEELFHIIEMANRSASISQEVSCATHTCMNTYTCMHTRTHTHTHTQHMHSQHT